MKVPIQRLLNGALAGTALFAGWGMLGWPGLVLAITVIAFWMVLQFNRATRQMRNVAGRPKGMVDSVITLQAKLGHGMTMEQVLEISQSLGQRLDDSGSDWMWRDSYGNQIIVTFRRGGVVRWHASRTDAPDMPSSTTTQGNRAGTSSIAAA
jgi:hypothetical protein